MNWITWENVGVDRIACAWLIRKKIDSDAAFLFIRRGADYKEMDGIPFDIPGVNLSHKRGKCTFCTFLKEYEINDKILDRICAIVDAADSVNELLPAPEAAGLDLICRGLTKVLRDDSKALEIGGIIFEAIYTQLAEEG
ncbi:MAG TPA: chromate resistance protein ChrB domain-containing protein [Syntrophobacteraceae bacterium]|nr:chromate resistance protein ChrB domain-containing protein [Syntrophobacteraceae bacterium]